MTGWVNCDERLPPPLVPVLAWQSSDFDDTGTLRLVYWDGGDWLTKESDDRVEGITHWTTEPEGP